MDEVEVSNSVLENESGKDVNAVVEPQQHETADEKFEDDAAGISLEDLEDENEPSDLQIKSNGMMNNAAWPDWKVFILHMQIEMVYQTDRCTKCTYDQVQMYYTMMV